VRILKVVWVGKRREYSREVFTREYSRESSHERVFTHPLGKDILSSALQECVSIPFYLSCQER